MSDIEKQPLLSYLINPLWKENQILVAILGICSALAVTTNLNIALTMSLSVVFVTGMSSFFVSLLRNHTPDNVRMITQLIIISLFVIIVDQFLQAFFFTISKTLSVFVGLIITNCIVMGRAEAMARRVPPLCALLDGVGAGLGYSSVLMSIGFLREFFGFGTLFGLSVIPESWYATPEHPARYVNIGIMPLAPAAFFLLGFFVWIAKSISHRSEEK